MWASHGASGAPTGHGTGQGLVRTGLWAWSLTQAAAAARTHAAKDCMKVEIRKPYTQRPFRRINRYEINSCLRPSLKG
jgi:hypothetical protein